MTDELKPCPFCGALGEAFSYQLHGCSTPSKDCPLGGLLMSPEEWNRRALPVEVVRVLEAVYSLGEKFTIRDFLVLGDKEKNQLLEYAMCGALDLVRDGIWTPGEK